MSIGQALDIQALRDTLAGERVLVRPFTYGDISEAYLVWLRDPEVVRFSSQRFRVHTLETCQAYQASFKDSANHFLAICDRTSGAMLGTLTVYRSVPHGTADIGIMVGERKVWGQGIGAEAFCLVLSALKASDVQGARLMGVWDHFYEDSAFSAQVSTHYVNLPHVLRWPHALDINELPLDQHIAWRWQDVQAAAVDDNVHPCVRVYAQWVVREGMLPSSNK